MSWRHPDFDVFHSPRIYPRDRDAGENLARSNGVAFSLLTHKPVPRSIQLNGEHRLPEKQYAYEESIRVRLYLRDSGVVGGRDMGALVLKNDLAPTFAEVAGARETLPVGGRSFVRLLTEDAPTSWRKRFLNKTHPPVTLKKFNLPLMFI